MVEIGELMVAINSHLDENMNRQHVINILKQSEQYGNSIKEKFRSTVVEGEKRRTCEFCFGFSYKKRRGKSTAGKDGRRIQ